MGPVEALERRLVLSTSDPGSTIFADFDSLTIDPDSYSSSSILVQARRGATAEELTDVVEGTEAIALSHTMPGFFEVRLPDGTSIESALKSYQSSSGVLLAEPNYRIRLAETMTPNDSRFDSLWGLNNTGQTGGTEDADIDAPEAWTVTTGSGSTVVAVIDTGVDFSHEDLADNMWTNSGEIPGNGQDDDGNGYVDDVHGYDFFNDDSSPMDDHGHGTHVAGTLGAVGDNDLGISGLAWDVQIMALKFLNSDGSGYTSDAVRALDYAVAQGAHVSNNSWGGGGFSQAMHDAIARAQDAGHIFVAAAGNSGTDNDASPHYPSNYDLDNVISVAATDDNDELASFSNYGATTVDLAAPGVGILSTTPGNAYHSWSGTSMAAPHVSGVVALLQSRNPDWTYQETINRIYGSVDPLSSLEGKTVTGGRLNAAIALGASGADSVGPQVWSTSPSGGVTGPVETIRLTFNEAIDPQTFTAADVSTFEGPNGAITIAGIDPVAGSNGRQFDVSFSSQSTLGHYRMVIGPNIADEAGNLMDQDRDGTSGESVEDRFTAAFELIEQEIFSSGTINRPIRDADTITSTLEIDRPLAIADLNVQLDVSHTWTGDLKITLIGPDGTHVRLTEYRGSRGDDYSNTLFDDEAETPISAGTAPFAGAFRPEESLSAFDGTITIGTWSLKIHDRLAPDAGTLHSWSLQVQPDDLNVANLSGAWTDNGYLNSAEIQQDDLALVFTNRVGRQSAGYFANASQVVATDWGNLTGTVRGDRIDWANGVVWREGSQNLPELSGIWSDAGVRSSAAVRQDGGELTFINRLGKQSAGRFLAVDRVVATDWGHLQGRIEDGGSRILWDNGVAWTKSPDSLPDLGGAWTDAGDPASAEIQQDGRDLLITNRRGWQTSGYFLSGNRIVATDWGHLNGRLEDGGSRILWDNGVVWNKTPDSVPDLGGTWADAGDPDSAEIKQDGQDLLITNRRGRQTSGYFLSADRIVATDWGNLNGRLEDNGSRILWDNGVLWEKSGVQQQSFALGETPLDRDASTAVGVPEAVPPTSRASQADQTPQASGPSITLAAASPSSESTAPLADTGSPTDVSPAAWRGPSRTTDAGTAVIDSAFDPTRQDAPATPPSVSPGDHVDPEADEASEFRTLSEEELERLFSEFGEEVMDRLLS